MSLLSKPLAIIRRIPPAMHQCESVAAIHVESLGILEVDSVLQSELGSTSETKALRQLVRQHLDG